MEIIPVALGERSYNVYIDDGLISRIGEYIKDKEVFIVTNPVVGPLFLPPLAADLYERGTKTHEMVISDGEGAKTLEEVERIYDFLVQRGAQRMTPLIALGGGVVGDVAGFAAATFMRGMPFIQVPTTLLSQVDSSVGGKTGVNHPNGKNLIGAFYQPSSVYIDIDTLKTLPDREFRSGIAEVIKYGIIADKELFCFLEKNRDLIFDREKKAMRHIIGVSVRIKADIVSRDERETGLRSVLNFGHTVGHAIEKLSGYGTFQHGEAIAKGMKAAVGISVAMGMIKSDEANRIERLLLDYGFDLMLPPFSREEYLDIIARDKKRTGDFTSFVLTEGIGCVSLKSMKASDILDFIDY